MKKTINSFYIKLVLGVFFIIAVVFLFKLYDLQIKQNEELLMSYKQKYDDTIDLVIYKPKHNYIFR